MISRRRRRIDGVTIAVALTVVLLLVAGFFWRRFEYRECRTVGHSVFYCLTHDGGNDNR